MLRSVVFRGSAAIAIVRSFGRRPIEASRSFICWLTEPEMAKSSPLNWDFVSVNPPILPGRSVRRSATPVVWADGARLPDAEGRPDPERAGARPGAEACGLVTELGAALH